MSATPWFEEEDEDSRTLWRAVFRLDDVEIGDRLFWLFARHCLAPQELAVVTRVLAPTVWERCWHLLRHPYSIPLGENPTWEQCLAAHPSLLSKMRRDRHLRRVPVPSYPDVAGALHRVLQGVAELADPKSINVTPPSQMRVLQVQGLRRMLARFPRHLSNADIATWVDRLDEPDWKKRFNARLVIHAVGIDALPALWRAKMRRHMARLSKRLIQTVIQENRSRFDDFRQFVCVGCYSRFQQYAYDADTEPHRAASWVASWIGNSEEFYSACRQCKSARYARKTTRITCIVGETAAFEKCHHASAESAEGRLNDGQSAFDDATNHIWTRMAATPDVPPREIAVPWSLVGRPFDFDVVHVGRAEESEIERYAATLLADSDRVRLRHRPSVSVRLEFPERLSANSLNILSRMFPKALKAARLIANNRLP
jgi:hypothetical protein